MTKLIIKKIKNATLSSILAKSDVLLIFFICAGIYLANGVTISSGDSVPNTLLAFNLLENHTLHLDTFRNSYFVEKGFSYAFAEGNNGHLSSTYPIGPAIVTFPLYLLFYLYLKLIYYHGEFINLTSPNFEVLRLFFEKIAATVTTAGTVVLFYLSSRLKFNRSVSLISTFIFAFATNTWMTSSQGLWQHGISNLALVSSIFCLLKANRTSQVNQKKWLLLAGVACGLLPGIRPTSTLFSIGIIVYSIFTYRFQVVFLFFGLVSVIPSFAWNLYYFGNLSGGYSKMFNEPPYLFTFNNFINAFLGTLISPSRGVLIFSPIVLFSLPGAYYVFKSRSEKDEKLVGCITICSIFLLISYFFYTVWWAGHSYGPRFTTDIMPVLCYLTNYFLTNHLLNQKKETLTKYYFLFFIILLIYSLFTQIIGAFSGVAGFLWNGIPLNADKYQYRLWQFRDSQIERNANSLFHKIIKPSTTKAVYLQGLSGIIKQVTDEKGQPVGSLISVKPGSEKFLKAYLKNTGVSTWYGYQSALKKGEARVRGIFYNNKNQPVQEVRLYISGLTKEHETANAIGSISFPKEPGTYKLAFDLIAEGVGEFPKNNNVDQFYTLTVIIEGQRHFAQEIQVLEPLKFGKVNKTVKIPVIVKNTSDSIWQNAGAYPVNLAYHWLDANGKVIVFDGDCPRGSGKANRTPLPKNLAVQSFHKLNATIKFPDKPGKYYLALTMVQEGVAWFDHKNANSLKIPVEVVAQ